MNYFSYIKINTKRLAMTRGFNYSKTTFQDCYNCYQCVVNCAKGHICGYDELPAEKGYRCGLFGLREEKSEKTNEKQKDLFDNVNEPC